MFHPVLMFKEPLNGLLDSLFKHGLRIPADLCFDLVRCDSITTVMSFSVSHVSDQLVAYQSFSWISIRQHLLKGIQDNVNDLDVLLLVVSADVITLAQLPENAKYLQSDLTAGTCLSCKLTFFQPQLCIFSYRMPFHRA